MQKAGSASLAGPSPGSAEPGAAEAACVGTAASQTCTSPRHAAAEPSAQPPSRALEGPGHRADDCARSTVISRFDRDDGSIRYVVMGVRGELPDSGNETAQCRGKRALVKGDCEMRLRNFFIRYRHVGYAFRPQLPHCGRDERHPHAGGHKSNDGRHFRHFQADFRRESTALAGVHNLVVYARSDFSRIKNKRLSVQLS